MGSHDLALLFESLVKHYTSSQMLVIAIDLFTEFVHKLVKAKIHLSLNFIIKKLFSENCQRIVCTVVIQIQGIQNTPNWKK